MVTSDPISKSPKITAFCPSGIVMSVLIRFGCIINDVYAGGMPTIARAVSALAAAAVAFVVAIPCAASDCPFDVMALAAYAAADNADVRSVLTQNAASMLV